VFVCRAAMHGSLFQRKSRRSTTFGMVLHAA
jgi:hypothetical protein